LNKKPGGSILLSETGGLRTGGNQGERRQQGKIPIATYAYHKGVIERERKHVEKRYSAEHSGVAEKKRVK